MVEKLLLTKKKEWDGKGMGWSHQNPINFCTLDKDSVTKFLKFTKSEVPPNVNLQYWSKRATMVTTSLYGYKISYRINLGLTYQDDLFQ